jgi:SAM-dependent methyltransferase
MLDQDRIAIQDRYRKRWSEFGVDSRTLGWNKDCQWVRFEALIEGIRVEEICSILDVGCGFGDLLGFLRERGWKGQYTGIDLVPEFTDVAQDLHKKDSAARFICGDLPALPAGFKSDLGVAIGIFNHRVEQGNLPFVRETVATMWDLTNALVVCDFLSNAADAERRQDHLYYADPAQMHQVAAEYSRRSMIHHAYMPFEFQLKIWHDDAFEVSAPVFPPYRHLASAQTEWRKGPKDVPK